MHPAEASRSRAVVLLLQGRYTAVWAVLLAIGLVSFWLGSGHELGATTASVIVLVVAFIKIRWVGLYFMELKEAPRLLRTVFELYCVVVCALTVGFFLVG